VLEGGPGVDPIALHQHPLSPWVLRYTDVSDGAINAWVFGVVTVLVALWAWSGRQAVQRPMGPDRPARHPIGLCRRSGAATGRSPPATAPFMSVAAAPSPKRARQGEPPARRTRRTQVLEAGQDLVDRGGDHRRRDDRRARRRMQ
jgi:hypothetical protein